LKVVNNIYKKNMKLVKQSYEILTPLDRDRVLRNIERAGRVCYKSESKITDNSAPKFVSKIVASGHLSVIEHQSFTVKFICDKGVANQLVRHRIASFSQESTRYCNYASGRFGKELTFVIPVWLDLPEGEVEEGKLYAPDAMMWLNAMQHAEYAYNSLMNEWRAAQRARSVLPLSVKTELIVTANHREWREIFRQRCAPDAHPQMVELMTPLRDELLTILPEIYG